MNILHAANGSLRTKRMLACVAAHDEWLRTLHRYVVVTAMPPVPARPSGRREIPNTKYRREGITSIFRHDLCLTATGSPVRG